jgi:rubrerythrin
LEDVYERLEDESQDERARLLLDYLREHEENFKNVLRRYSQEEHSGVLDTWIQYDPEEDLRRALEESEMRPGMSLDELLAQAQRFNQAVISFYREALAQTNAPRVRELFESLLAMEEGKAAKYAWSALGLVEEGRD